LPTAGGIVKILAILIFVFLVSPSFSKEKVLGKEKAQNPWQEVVCLGGDALDTASLEVEFTPREDTVHLTVETGASENEKDNLIRKYTAHLEKGAFLKMLHEGRVEMVLSSDKHPETAFGGETSFAALVDLVKGKNDGFKGYMALDGSVFEVDCPKDPTK
jgi:hypothetical protein